MPDGLEPVSVLVGALPGFAALAFTVYREIFDKLRVVGYVKFREKGSEVTIYVARIAGTRGKTARNSKVSLEFMGKKPPSGWMRQGVGKGFVNDFPYRQLDIDTGAVAYLFDTYQNQLVFMPENGTRYDFKLDETMNERLTVVLRSDKVRGSERSSTISSILKKAKWAASSS